MSHDEILQAAKEVGAVIDVLMLGRHDNTVFTTGELERFAAIIEKRTIERCAVSAEPNPDDGTLVYVIKQHIAAAIRKLGEQE